MLTSTAVVFGVPHKLHHLSRVSTFNVQVLQRQSGGGAMMTNNSDIF